MVRLQLNYIFLSTDWKTQGGAVRSLTNIYPLHQTITPP